MRAGLFDWNLALPERRQEWVKVVDVANEFRVLWWGCEDLFRPTKSKMARLEHCSPEDEVGMREVRQKWSTS